MCPDMCTDMVYRHVYRHVCSCVYRHVYIHVCRHVYRHMYRHACSHVYIYMYRHMYCKPRSPTAQWQEQVHRHVYRHVTRMHNCTDMYIDMSTCICTDMSIRTGSPAVQQPRLALPPHAEHTSSAAAQWFGSAGRPSDDGATIGDRSLINNMSDDGATIGDRS